MKEFYFAFPNKKIISGIFKPKKEKFWSNYIGIKTFSYQSSCDNEVVYVEQKQ